MYILLRHIGRVASAKKMSMFVPGIFGSKVCYALPLLASIWGLEEYACFAKNKLSCPKEVITKLQVLQNQAARLTCPDTYFHHLTPTAELLESAGLISIHQQMALNTIRLAIRVIRTGQPRYLADRFQLVVSKSRKPKRLAISNLKLNVSLESFIHQSSVLIHRLPDEIWHERSHYALKAKLRWWVSENILVKP